ncbi:MAG: transglycosylase SLT domain-containing protein, partial [Desulfobulbaceae bacterium]|nr:transglycosylase SLT domain-containing protein [Desulfobulbaceae bacterium]
MKQFTLLVTSSIFLMMLIVLAPTPGAAQKDPFPTYSCIESNVTFWKKVYGKYSSSQGLIHDKNNIAIIYEIISLHSSDTPEGQQANECNITAIKEKYQAILSRLAQGQIPSTPEEKRVAGLFGPHTKPATFLTAADNIRFQRGISDRFSAGIIRSGRYLSHIKKILNSYNLPTDLAYLPHVESSFDYQAYSKVGAAGIWQFMPSTG